MRVQTKHGYREVSKNAWLNKEDDDLELWYLAMHCSNFASTYLIYADDENDVLDAFIEHPAGSHYILDDEEVEERGEDYVSRTSFGVAYDSDLILALERCKIVSED